MAGRGYAASTLGSRYPLVRIFVGLCQHQAIARSIYDGSVTLHFVARQTSPVC